MNFEFMTIDTPLPPCMPFPIALTGFPVSSTAKVMYCRMLDAMLKGCNFAIISHVHNLLCVHVCVIYTYPYPGFPYLDKPYPARPHTAGLCPGDGASRR